MPKGAITLPDKLVLGTTESAALSAPPTADSVTPSAGSGSSQTFTFKYSSPNGYNYLAQVFGLINASLSGANGCYFQYSAAANKLSLYNNGGGGIAGILTPGISSTVSNSQCSISGSSFTASGIGNQLTLVLPIAFASSFVGSKTIFAFALDQGNQNSAWQTLGTWTPSSPLNTPPTADSVSPSSGIGITRTFVFNDSSVNGFSYISRVFGLINSSLSGANACYFQYYAPANILYLYDNDGTGVAGILTPGTATTISNDQCTINGMGLLATGAATQFTVRVPVTFSGTFTGIKNIYGVAIDQANLNSGWQTLGTWITNNIVNAPPTADSITPNSGAGVSQTFTLKYSSLNGYAYLGRVFGLINSSLSGASACYFQYYASANTLYLYDNSGGGIAGTLAPGAATTINNGQCTISGSGLTTSGAANQLTLVIPITFSGSFTGSKNVYGFAIDQGNLNSSWQVLGAWTTDPVVNTPPTVDSVTPASGSGASQTFTFKYFSANGYSYLSRVFGLINSSLSGTTACYFQYYVPANTLYLYDDSGGGIAGTLTPGAATTINNSQCAVSGSGFTASGAGSQFTLVVPITFSGTFLGTKNVYGFALDQGGLNSSWQPLGTWTH